MAKVNFDQWADFKGHLWKEEVNVRDFIQHNYTTTILSMTEMSLSLQARQKQQTNFGESFPSCRKKSVQKAAFWIWRQRLFPV